jgi:hypothetical protein
MAGSVQIDSAISVLWGAILCGLGYWVFLAGIATYKSRMAAANGIAVLPCFLLVTTLLATLAMLNLLSMSADAMNLFDWFGRVSAGPSLSNSLALFNVLSVPIQVHDSDWFTRRGAPDIPPR